MQSSQPSLPTNLAHAYVAAQLPCKKCGYDLRGLRASGRCPECGSTIWTTIARTLDPDATRLPQLRDPVGVGDALLWLTFAMFLGVLLIVAAPVALELDKMDPTGVRDITAWTPWWLRLIAAVFALSGLWSVFKLAPPRGEETSGAVWLDIWLIAGGLATFAFAITLNTLLGPSISFTVKITLRLAMAVAAALTLFGLRGVFGVVGQRSRQYRTSRGGRQGADAMLIAIALGAAGDIASSLARQGVMLPYWRELGQNVVWVTTFLVLVGLAYLIVNAAWIRSSLRHPPPLVDQLLLPT